MEKYKELYYELFNKITDIIEELKRIQLDAEEKFVCVKNKGIEK